MIESPFLICDLSAGDVVNDTETIFGAVLSTVKSFNTCVTTFPTLSVNLLEDHYTYHR